MGGKYQKPICLILVCSLMYLNACAAHHSRITRQREQMDGLDLFVVNGQGVWSLKEGMPETKMQARKQPELYKHPACVAGCCLGTALIASAVFLLPRVDESDRDPYYIAGGVVGGCLIYFLSMWAIMATSGDSSF